CAVLIGGFKDDKEARAALEKIKKLPLPELKLASDRPAYDRMKVVEPAKDGKGKSEVREEIVNPLSRAFVTRNPTMPQQAAGYKPDAFWKELNAEEDYSVLKCKARWTLAVAQFDTTRIVQSKAKPSEGGFLEKLGMGGKKPGESLNAMALQAHSIAETLNKQLKIEAYVLHTRTASILTIGGFDSPEDPRYQRAQETFATLRSHLDPQAAQTL